ncbi:syndecan-4 isoform X2 [Clupea harengus]|uniref:Syndecan n=1 Tax=Clupea harengus TaxID=7950 RepID=A0A6P3WB96_CLUHA|nr:syndecan-4 isoform X2 [Clupea harengus]
MQKLFLVLFVVASVYSESVRETETWMPTKGKQSHEDLVSSGDSQNGSDFELTSDDEDLVDDYDSLYDDESSGSGDGVSDEETAPTSKPDLIDNRIPEQGGPVKPQPTVNENDIVLKNEVGVRSSSGVEDRPPNVLMSQAGDESFFNKTEVVAALIAGGAVGLLFSVLLILLLIYRMKKKDEGSYALGKKPIYTKAASTEIYA